MSEQSHTEQQPFVELNRRFRKLDQKAKAEETALDSYTVGLLWPDKNLSWDDLLKESRVIVLGEPGSGKTWELRERVRLLKHRLYQQCLQKVRINVRIKISRKKPVPVINHLILQ